MADLSWMRLGAFGATVDIDLGEPITEQHEAQLRDLYDEHHFLYFPHQKLTYEEQLGVAGIFGEAIREKQPSIIRTEDGLGTKELAFHNDMACCEMPLEGLSLHALDVDEGTSTLFVSNAGACERLPDEVRERIRSLKGLHLWPSLASSSERRRGSPETPIDWPGATHPLLFMHPRTQSELLFISAGQTERVLDLGFGESEELIKALFSYLYDERFMIDHKWKDGDLLVWDNMAVQHGRRRIERGTKRYLQRVAMGVDHSYNNMPEEFRAAYRAEQPAR